MRSAYLHAGLLAQLILLQHLALHLPPPLSRFRRLRRRRRLRLLARRQLSWRRWHQRCGRCDRQRWQRTEQPAAGGPWSAQRRAPSPQDLRRKCSGP